MDEFSQLNYFNMLRRADELARQVQRQVQRLRLDAQDYLTMHGEFLVRRAGVEIGDVYVDTKTGKALVVTKFDFDVAWHEGLKDYIVRVKVHLVQRTKAGKARQNDNGIWPFLQQLADYEGAPEINPALTRYAFVMRPETDNA